MTLARALDAVSREAWSEAADALIAVWRKTPSLRIARLVERIDVRSPAQPIDGSTVRAREIAWKLAARDAGDAIVPRLLATPWPIATTDARARVRMLEELPRSPRIATAVRAMPRYDTLAGRQLAADAAALMVPATEPAWSTADDAQLVKLEAALAAPARHDLDALLAGVYASPSDDGPREVLADALTELGDPRGEFIMLQLSRARTGRGNTKREAALLRQHATAWDGGIAGNRAYVSAFARGFPAAAATRSGQCRALGWATIESLLIANHDIPIRDPANLRALRWLHEVRVRDLPAYGIGELDYLGVIGNEPRALAAPTTLAPRILGLRDSGEKALVAAVRHAVTIGSPLGRRVEILRVPALPGLSIARTVLAASRQVREVHVGTRVDPHLDHPRGWTAEASRTGVRLTWHGKGPVASARGLLDVAFDEVTVVGTLTASERREIETHVRGSRLTFAMLHE